MDNCDLEKLSISAGKLQPAFSPKITHYRVVVESGVSKVTLNPVTSDRGASYSVVSSIFFFLFFLSNPYMSVWKVHFVFQLSRDRSSAIKLDDGLNRVDVEVVAEDGTVKKYRVEITKLSSKIAELSNLVLDGDIPLHPTFSTNVYEYNCE